MNNIITVDANRQLLLFFEDVFQAYQQAGNTNGGTIDRHYSIGGNQVKLCFAGSALIPFITPALDHLVSESVKEPALTVCLWDSASTNVRMPSPPWGEEDYLARGKIRGCSDKRIQIAYHLGSFILSMLDLERSMGIFWIRDASKVLFGDRASPLRAIFHWWMRSNNLQMLHAATVSTREGGVLIPGKSGSGKSTVALACLLSGLNYLGDDHILVGDANLPIAYSLYNSAKLHYDHLCSFPDLASKVRNKPEHENEKAVIYLYEHFPELIREKVEIRKILIPEITDSQESKICNASKAESLRALAPSTLFQLTGSASEDFQSIAKVVKEVPSFKLMLGTDLSQIPGVIQRSFPT